MDMDIPGLYFEQIWAYISIHVDWITNGPGNSFSHVRRQAIILTSADL